LTIIPISTIAQENMNTEFGELLKKLRKATGLNQQELGEKISMHSSAICRYEKGTIPNPETLSSIVNVLASEQVDHKDLDKLWKAANPYLTETLNPSASDSQIEVIRHLFEIYPEGEKGLLRKDIQKTIELNQDFNIARKFRKEKKWGDGVTKLNSLRAKMDLDFHDRDLRVEEALGDCYYGSISFSEALGHYEQAMSSATYIKDTNKQKELLIKIGNVFRRRGGTSSKRAIDHYYSEARKIELSDRKCEAGCLRKEGGAWLFLGRPDEAQKLLDQSLAICYAENWDLGTYKGMQHMAWACSMLGRWSEAVRLCWQALLLIPESNQWDHIKGLRYLADSMRLARQTDEAEEIYNQALNMVNHLGVEQSRTVGLIYLGLAKLYLKKDGEEGHTKELLDKGLMCHGGAGEDFRAIDFFVELGYFYLKSGKFDEAETKLNMAKRQYLEQGNCYFHARTLALLSELYYKKETSNRIVRLEEIVAEAKRLDNGLINYFLGKILYFYGKALLDDRQIEKAAEVWKLSTEKFLSFNVESFQESSIILMGEFDRIAKSYDNKEAIQVVKLYRGQLAGGKYDGVGLEVIEKELDKLQEKIKVFQELVRSN
jgi:tetratricopeptide (TPR) repeat protein